MDYVRLYTTLHSDPDMMVLSDGAFRLYVLALSWCGQMETLGVFDDRAVASPTRTACKQLVAAGKFECTADPHKFVIHGWPTRQAWEAKALDRKVKATNAANARWHPEADAPSIATEHEATDAHKSRGEEIRGEKSRGDKSLATLPRRDDLFEALCEACGIEWQSLTSTGRGAANRALAELRGVKATPEEIHRRAGNWPSLFDADTTLTAPALAKHWAQLATRRDVHSRTTNLALAMADEMEGR